MEDLARESLTHQREAESHESAHELRRSCDLETGRGHHLSDPTAECAGAAEPTGRRPDQARRRPPNRAALSASRVGLPALRQLTPQLRDASLAKERDCAASRKPPGRHSPTPARQVFIFCSSAIAESVVDDGPGRPTREAVLHRNGAQLSWRAPGSPRRVSGSSPLGSTPKAPATSGAFPFLFLSISPCSVRPLPGNCTATSVKRSEQLIFVCVPPRPQAKWVHDHSPHSPAKPAAGGAQPAPAGLDAACRRRHLTDPPGPTAQPGRGRRPLGRRSRRNAGRANTRRLSCQRLKPSSTCNCRQSRFERGTAQEPAAQGASPAAAASPR